MVGRHALLFQHAIRLVHLQVVQLKQRNKQNKILLKCGQIFSLPQSIYKTVASRVKVNRTNNNQNRLALIKPE